MSDLSLNVESLPTNFCPSTYQAMLAGFGAALSVTIPSGANGISISATKPSNTSNIWFQIDALGRFQRMYLYGQGAWLSAHPLVPGATIWWFSALPTFSSFDGGDSGSLGPQSGPMWQAALDSNSNAISGQFICVPGTLEPSGTVIALGATGGEDQHTLSTTELAPHTHDVIVSGRNGASGNGLINFNGVTGVNATQDFTSNATGGGGPHNTMPPYATGYLLQRTTRLFYAVN